MLRHPFPVLLLFCWIAGCTTAPDNLLEGTGLTALSTKPLPGGWFRIKVDDELYRLARFAVRDIPEDTVTRVYNARAQEIIGISYLFAIEMKSGKKWLAELYQDQQGKVTLLEISAISK